MAKKHNLPILAENKRPSIEAARAKLGGVITSEAAPPAFAPGVVVTITTSEAERVPAVVIFASSTEVHALEGASLLRRLPVSAALAHHGPVALELEKIAGDARLFGLLVNGQAVRYADGSGELVDGVLVEKCRWGALVARADGVVIAVGFQNLARADGGERMRAELTRLLDALLATPGEITLDALGDAIGARAVSAVEIDEMVREIERRGRTLATPAGGHGEATLKLVLAAARTLRGELGRAPRAAEIAERAGISTSAVEHALALAKIIQR